MHRVQRRVVAVLTVALIICLASSGWLTWQAVQSQREADRARAALEAERRRPAPYDPLAEYPVQRVDSKLVGYDTPAVKLSEGQVVITGTKCSKRETSVDASSSWVEIKPGGLVVSLGGGSAVRTAGCTTRTFYNDIPARVAERARVLHARGIDESVWQLAGHEVPYASDGRRGVRRSWQSQNFTLVYDL